MLKYLCIKDFWMYQESVENGNIPAFASGGIYFFEEVIFEDEVSPVPDIDRVFYTAQDNQKEIHCIDYDELLEYFKSLEDL